MTTNDELDRMAAQVWAEWAKQRQEDGESPLVSWEAAKHPRYARIEDVEACRQEAGRRLNLAARVQKAVREWSDDPSPWDFIIQGTGSPPKPDGEKP